MKPTFKVGDFVTFQGENMIYLRDTFERLMGDNIGPHKVIAVRNVPKVCINGTSHHQIVTIDIEGPNEWAGSWFVSKEKSNELR
jgi:hypothetical protein